LIIFTIIDCRVCGCRAFIFAMIARNLQIDLESRMMGITELSGFAFEPDPMTQAKSDPGAFTRLYLRHYDAIFRYCAHRLFERTTAEDITSEVFLKMVENFQTFDGNEKQFRNWLYRIATNAVNEHIRKTTRRSAILAWVWQGSSKAGVDDGAVAADESQGNQAAIKKALRMLKPEEQAIVTMRFFENLKTEEIAEVVGTSASTVRSQLSRAMEKLRKHISSAQLEGQEVTL
jgi:RNA polymerase sigma-70 factor, ECF subfamily